MQTTRTLLADQYIVTHRVDEAHSGIRLDRFLKVHYRKRSREALKKAIDSGIISIERKNFQVGKVRASTPLLPGDVVQVLSDRKPEPRVNFNYRVLYQDDAIAVIEKPPNLPVHPAGRYFFNTLLVHLRTAGFTEPLEAEREFFLVHRIDRETSGILILTRKREACASIVEQFAKRQTRKTYLAVVHGTPPETFSMKQPLGRALGSRIRVRSSELPIDQGGQEAHTDFKRLSTHGNFSLVKCFPRTGRQHQIRVHLELAGHPIVGDKLYGRTDSEAIGFFEPPITARPEIVYDPAESSGHPGYLSPLPMSPELEAKLMLPRHALHAAEIEFKHPITGELLHFESKLPEDLQRFLEKGSKVIGDVDLSLVKRRSLRPDHLPPLNPH